MTDIGRTQQIAGSPVRARTAAPTAAAAQATAPRAHVAKSAASGPAQAAAGAQQLTIPDWVKDAVFYQVFPDRFANGDMGNDPAGVQQWGSQPTNEGFMGGDLQGVTQRLGYLGDLGVNALYLNPIFEAPSNHKYNTANYEQVDDDFGGNAAFETMMDAAHKGGMKVMLDGVLNHVSHQHDWFKDVREKGPKSAFANRFDVTNWPIKYTRDEKGVLRSDDYKSWWNYATLPVLQTDNAEVRDYFLTGKDAIVKRWIRDGKIDGWRMDVADDTNFSADYWRTARREIKSANPDAYMVAENWKDASSMLQGDQFDGTMNYQHFTWPAVEFFGQKKISADQFIKRLENGYSKEANFGAFNILDSHDTPRFITQAGGDWYRQRPAAIFQMTYVGAPVIYYGDELGMEGAADPDSRRAMDWNLVPNAKNAASDHKSLTTVPASNGSNVSKKERAAQLFGLYKTLIATRKDVAALRRGDFSVVMADNASSTVAYRRSISGDARDAVTVLNNAVTGQDRVRVPVSSFAPDGTKYTDALSGTTFTVNEGSITIDHLDGNFGAVLVRDV